VACVTDCAGTIERPGRRFGLAAGVLLLCGAMPAVQAFELAAVETTRDGPAYVLRIEAVFQATPGQLLAVLTDYDEIHRLHPRMVESRSLGQVGPETTEVFTQFEGCVLVFCRTVRRVEQIRIEGRTLRAVDVPGRGSFSEGSTEWHFSGGDGGTRLRYEARFVPAFPVAPILGPTILARSVERMTLETMAEADRRALLRNE
jgi:hypothetical protein